MASATWVGIAPQAELTNAARAARTARTSVSPRRHRATWSVTRARTAFPRAWRIGRVACISGVGPTEQLVRRLKEAERLAEVAVAGGAAPEHVEREAECREVPAPGAVPDLRGAGDVALQDLYGGAVLLEVLGREVLEVDLDHGDEIREGHRRSARRTKAATRQPCPCGITPAESQGRLSLK